MVAKFALLSLPGVTRLRMDLRQSRAANRSRRRTSRRRLVRGSKGEDKLDALRKRANEIKAALEAVQAKQRQQEKADDRQVKALIGTAMVADVEGADKDEQTKRKA